MFSLPQLTFSIKADLTGLKAVGQELNRVGKVGQQTGQAISKGLSQGAASAAGDYRRAGNQAGINFGDAFGRNSGSRIKEALGRMSQDSANAGRNAGQSFGKGFQSATANIFQGISQGIGQQLTAGVAKAVGGLKDLAFNRDALASYDSARAKVSTLTDDMEGMAKMAKQVSREVRGSASQAEILAASYDVLSAGFSEAADSANILANAQKGAIGGMSDLNTVANATTTILNAYGLSAANADKVVNQMIGTQNAGKIVVGQYASMIGNVATTAAQAGVPLEELNAFIATATVKGVKASSSIDGMRAAISAVLKPSQEASEYAGQLGINFSAAGLRANGLVGILQQLRAKNADSADSLVRLFGSVEAVAAIIPSAGDGLEDFAKNLETIKSSSADDAFAKMQNSIEGVQKKNAVLREELALKFQVATQPLFEAANTGMEILLGYLNEGGVLFEGLNQAASQFRDFIEQNPEIIGAMVEALSQLAQTGLGLLTDGIISFTNTLRENPQLIQDMATGLVEATQTVIQFARVMGDVLGFISDLLAPLTEAQTLLLEIAGSAISNAIKFREWDDILLGVNYTINECINWIKGVFNSIGACLNQSSIFRNAWGVITKVIELLLRPYKMVFDAIVGALKQSQIFRNVWDAVINIAGKVGQAFKDKVGSVLDWLISKAQGLLGVFGQFGQGGGGGGGGAVGLGDISKLSASAQKTLSEPGFVEKLGQVAGRLGVQSQDLLTAMLYETAGSLSPSVKGPYVPGDGAATGLIQFMPSTARGLGTTDTALAGMSATQQLDYVEKYLAPFKGQLKSYDNIYKAIHAGDPNSSGNLSDGYRTTNQAIAEAKQMYAGLATAALSGGGVSGGGIGAVAGFAQGLMPSSAKSGPLPGSISGGLDASGQNGGDMPVGPNNEIYSYHTGRVSQIGSAGNNGNYIVIDFLDDLGNKLEATYSHVAAAVKVGDAVKGGQVIGKFDGSGRTFGAHNSVDVNSPGNNGSWQRSQETPAAKRAADLLIQGKVLGSESIGGTIASANFPSSPELSESFEEFMARRSRGTNALGNPSAKLDNTVANLKADPSAENQKMKQAVEAARKQEDDRTKIAREEAARKLKQAREEAKLKLEADAASFASPEAKEASARALKELEVRAQYEDRLLDLEQKRDDLKKARERKLTDLKSKDTATAAAAKALPDFTAQIKAYDELIAKDKQLQDLAIKNIDLAATTAQSEEDRKSAIERRNAELEKSLEFAAAEAKLELDRAARTDPIQAAQLEYLEQRRQLQAELNKTLQTEFDKLSEIERKLAELAKVGAAGAPDVKRLQDERNSLNMRIGDMQATANVKLRGFDEAQAAEMAKLQRARNQALLDKDSMLAEGSMAGRSRIADKMRSFGNEQGALNLEKENALIKLNLEYRAKHLELEQRIADMRAKGVAVSDAEAASMRSSLDAMKSFDLNEISTKFDYFQSQIMPTVQDSVGGFFKTLLDGSKSVGEAFSDMIGNITSKIFDFAANQIVSSVFGGMFGGASSGDKGGDILSIFGFANGGIVGAQSMTELRRSPGPIGDALRKEGPSSVLAALTPGEMVLTTNQTKAFLRSPMKNEILNFNSGGIVPGAGSPAAMVGTSNSNGVNIALNVNGGDSGIDYAIVAKMAKSAAEGAIARQKRPRGSLT